MRRWDGWGDESVDAALGPDGRRLLEAVVGAASPVAGVSLADVVAAVPASRLAAHPLLSSDPELRVRRARGQSLPDLLELRSGRLAAVPDAVARPAEAGQVRALLDHARAAGARVVPYGGGTSVVGGVSVRPSRDPVVTVDLGRLAGLRGLDERSGLATVGAGTTGPALAAVLAPRGLVIGHEPQSWELATVGGWVDCSVNLKTAVEARPLRQVEACQRHVGGWRERKCTHHCPQDETPALDRFQLLRN